VKDLLNQDEYGVWAVTTQDATKAYNGAHNTTRSLGFFRGTPREIAEYVKRSLDPWREIAFSPVMVLTMTDQPGHAPFIVREDTDGKDGREGFTVKL
jgi:hypothetical protein